MTRLQILESYGVVECNDRPDGYDGYHVSMVSSNNAQEWHSIRGTKQKAINVVYSKVSRNLWHVVMEMREMK
jgi:hypothetical protein